MLLEPLLVPMTAEDEQRAVEILDEVLAALFINEPARDGKPTIH